MQILALPRPSVVGLVSFSLSFILLHPFSMFIQGLASPTAKANFHNLADAFKVQHLPMAFFFGLLGLVAGTVGLFLIALLLRERERVKILEGFLAICSYCKKIRDDEGSAAGQGPWVEIEHYISQHTDTDFSHGICPDCYAKVVKDFKKSKIS